MAFDTQSLLPNLEYKDDLEKNPMNRKFNYKVVYNLKLDKKKGSEKTRYHKNFKARWRQPEWQRNDQTVT